MKNLKIFTVAVFIVFLGCSDSDDTKVTNPIPTNDSFLPMSIGNYWKLDEQNFTKITDTLRIQGDLYYYFNSIIGGDTYYREYLRIDENQNLIRINYDTQETMLVAKFNMELGETHISNYESLQETMTLIEKEDNLRVYEYTHSMMNSLEDSKYYVTYVRGLGWMYPFLDNDQQLKLKEIKIDDVIYKF